VVRDYAGRGQRGNLFQRRRRITVRGRRLRWFGVNTQRPQVFLKHALYIIILIIRLH